MRIPTQTIQLNPSRHNTQNNMPQSFERERGREKYANNKQTTKQ